MIGCADAIQPFGAVPNGRPLLRAALRLQNPAVCGSVLKNACHLYHHTTARESGGSATAQKTEQSVCTSTRPQLQHSQTVVQPRYFWAAHRGSEQLQLLWIASRCRFSDLQFCSASVPPPLVPPLAAFTYWLEVSHSLTVRQVCRESLAAPLRSLSSKPFADRWVPTKYMHAHPPPPHIPLPCGPLPPALK
jgi:hypothetical protein